MSFKPEIDQTQNTSQHKVYLYLPVNGKNHEYQIPFKVLIGINLLINGKARGDNVITALKRPGNRGLSHNADEIPKHHELILFFHWP